MSNQSEMSEHCGAHCTRLRRQEQQTETVLVQLGSFLFQNQLINFRFQERSQCAFANGLFMALRYSLQKCGNIRCVLCYENTCSALKLKLQYFIFFSFYSLCILNFWWLFLYEQRVPWPKFIQSRIVVEYFRSL